MSSSIGRPAAGEAAQGGAKRKKKAAGPIELPDFMQEDDEQGSEDELDAQTSEARYDASYNAFMDELDREDDDQDDEVAQGSYAKPNNSISVLSTSLLPNRSGDAGEDADEDDHFDLFAPRRSKAADISESDVQDAEDPAYAQRLADILGSDDGDEGLEEDDEDEADEEEEEQEAALTNVTGITPSPSALEDARDAQRVEAELSVDQSQIMRNGTHDTTLESGLASDDIEEDDDDDDEEGFVYTPSQPEASASSTTASIRQQADDDDDDDGGFVYRPSPTSHSVPPKLPPILLDSSTPPRASAKTLPPAFLVSPPPPQAPRPPSTPPPRNDLPPSLPIIDVGLGLGASIADTSTASVPAMTLIHPPATPEQRSKIASLLAVPLRQRQLASLKVRPRLLTPTGSARSVSSTTVSSLKIPPFFPPPVPAPTASQSRPAPATIIERDILTLSSMRKVGAKLEAAASLSEAVQAKALGDPTVLAAGSGLIAIGTRRGWTLVFALDQELRCVIGTESLAEQGGSVTALSFSLDSTFVGVGHASGHIALYDLSKPSIPARHVQPVSLRSVQAGRKEGHLPGCAIVQLGFVGKRHTAIVSADAAGVAVYHALGKILGVSSNDTLRIFGQYPQQQAEDGSDLQQGGVSAEPEHVNGVDTASVNGVDLTFAPANPTRIHSSKSVLLGAQPLPLGSIQHIADAHQFVAILTPHKLVLVGLKPNARTWWRKTAPTPQQRTAPDDAARKGAKRRKRQKMAAKEADDFVQRRRKDGRTEAWAARKVAAVTKRWAEEPDADFEEGLEVGSTSLQLNGSLVDNISDASKTPVSNSNGGGPKDSFPVPASSSGAAVAESSPLRLVRGIPEGRTADDFTTSLPGPRTEDAVLAAFEQWLGEDDEPMNPDLPDDEDQDFGDGFEEDLESQDEDGPDDPQPALCGALSWLPASESSSFLDGDAEPSTVQQNHPVLAFSFGFSVFFLRLVKGRRQLPRSVHQPSGRKRPGSQVDAVIYEDYLSLQEEPAFEHSRPITALQWLSPDLLLITDARGLNLFDLRVQRCTEQQRLPNFRINLQRWDEDGVFSASPPQAGNGEATATITLAQSASHSFHFYEGRAFLLGSKDILSGSPLSWTDRMLSLVAAGDFLSAINLARQYYSGTAPGSIIGLPSDRDEQRRIVGKRLRDLMTASAQYAFSPARLTDNTHVTADGRGVDRTPLFEGMARVCALACLALDNLDFLFGDLYEMYADNGIEGIFVTQMEEFIVSGRMRTLPTDVVQRLVAFRTSTGDYALAEKIIYHVDPLCLDLHQAIGLCLDQRLWDALIYVYTEAMDDFVGPVVEFVELMKQVLYPASGKSNRQQGEPRSNGSADGALELETAAKAGPSITMEQDNTDAYTLFSYLSAGLLGLAYPSRKPYEPKRALQVRNALYGFSLAGSCILWPKGPGGKLVLSLPPEEDEPTYPYLRMLLKFDAEALLEVFETAFEDSFLNDEDDEDEGAATSKLNSHSQPTYTRQKIVDLLIEISESPALSLPSSDAKESNAAALQTAISIFIARNAPKFPQFISLGQTQVDGIFDALTSSAASSETLEERQLATEYLLSSHKISNGDWLLQALEQAGFWRLLQDALRRERRWDRLISIFVGELRSELDVHDVEDGLLKNTRGRDGFWPEDDWAETNVVLERPIFAQLEHVLSRAIRERTSWLEELGPRITEATPTLLRADVIRTVALIERFFPGRHHEALEALAGDELAQLAYLRCFFDPAFTRGYATSMMHTDELGQAQTQARARTALELLSVGERLEPANRDRYIALLARHRPDDLVQAFDAQPWADYIDLENGGRFLFDKHFGAKALGGDTLTESGRSGEEKEPLYREVKPFLDGMTSAYRLRIELLGMANRLFDRDLFGDLDSLAAKRMRGWRPRSAVTGPMSQAHCGVCGEALVASPTSLDPSSVTSKSSFDRQGRFRPGLRERQRSTSAISVPPPRPPSSPFIEAAAGGRARPDKGKGVSRGYFPPFEDADSPASVRLLSPKSALGVEESEAARPGVGRRLSGNVNQTPQMNGGPGFPVTRSMSTPLLAGASNLSPALGLGGPSNVFAEMQASDTQPVDLFAPDAAALGLPTDEDGEAQNENETGGGRRANAQGPWNVTFTTSPFPNGRNRKNLRLDRSRSALELGEAFEDGLGLRMGGDSAAAQHADERLVVFANGEVRHRRCCDL